MTEQDARKQVEQDYQHESRLSAFGQYIADAMYYAREEKNAQNAQTFLGWALGIAAFYKDRDRRLFFQLVDRVKVAAICARVAVNS